MPFKLIKTIEIQAADPAQQLSLLLMSNPDFEYILLRSNFVGGGAKLYLSLLNLIGSASFIEEANSFIITDDSTIHKFLKSELGSLSNVVLYSPSDNLNISIALF